MRTSQRSDSILRLATASRAGNTNSKRQRVSQYKHEAQAIGSAGALGRFADFIEVSEVTTVHSLFEQHISEGSASDYLIRVNRQPCSANQPLQEGDRVSITLLIIEGALR